MIKSNFDIFCCMINSMFSIFFVVIDLSVPAFTAYRTAALAIEIPTSSPKA